LPAYIWIALLSFNEDTIYKNGWILSYKETTLSSAWSTKSSRTKYLTLVYLDDESTVELVANAKHETGKTVCVKIKLNNNTKEIKKSFLNNIGSCKDQ
jgi:hypothetical protein